MSKSLLTTLSAASRFNPRVPQTRRRAFDVALPERWPDEVLRATQTAFGTNVVQRRPEAMLQAFIDTSFTSGRTHGSSQELARLGGSLLSLAAIEAAARSSSRAAEALKPSMPPQAVQASLLTPDLMSLLVSEVWKMDGLILTDQGRSALPLVFDRQRQAIDARRSAVPSEVAESTAVAVVAAVYMNSDIDTVSRFLHQHVMRPLAVLAAARSAPL